MALFCLQAAEILRTKAVYGRDERNPLLELCKIDLREGMEEDRVGVPGYGLDNRTIEAMIAALVEEFEANLEARQSFCEWEPLHGIGKLSCTLANN